MRGPGIHLLSGRSEVDVVPLEFFPEVIELLERSGYPVNLVDNYHIHIAEPDLSEEAPECPAAPCLRQRTRDPQSSASVSNLSPVGWKCSGHRCLSEHQGSYTPLCLVIRRNAGVDGATNRLVCGSFPWCLMVRSHTLINTIIVRTEGKCFSRTVIRKDAAGSFNLVLHPALNKLFPIRERFQFILQSLTLFIV